jgi:hypothetical protein
LELFEISDDPHDLSRMSRRVRGRIYGVETWAPTVEDLIITKLRWFGRIRRTKDAEDAKFLLLLHDQTLDWPYIPPLCDIHGTRQLTDAVRELT